LIRLQASSCQSRFRSSLLAATRAGNGAEEDMDVGPQRHWIPAFAGTTYMKSAAGRRRESQARKRCHARLDNLAKTHPRRYIWRL
jgi:hypothetical protein